jgi:hypothetical protein
MTIIAGVDRGFVPRAEAVSRLTTAMNFLEKAERFHGAWPHWMNGNDGKVILLVQRQRRRSSRNIISLSRIIDR